MTVGEDQEIGAQDMSLEVVWRNPLSRAGVSKIETGRQSILPVGRTGQQTSGAAVQLGRQSYLDRMESADQRSAR